MLRRIFASNFRTLVNFNVDLDSLTLLLGPNGAGKTTIFDVARLIRDFIRGDSVWMNGRMASPTTTELFPNSTRTRWQDVGLQSFEIALDGRDGHGEYIYRLEIEQDNFQQRCRVKTERLTFDGRPLFESAMRDNQFTAQLYRDDGSSGPTQLTDWTRSSLPFIQPRAENQLMTWFKDRMDRLIVARFNPAVITGQSDEESPVLAWDASNFVAWFRRMASLDLELVAKLRPLLEESIPGLVGLSLETNGADAKILKAKFRGGASAEARAKPFFCRFDELSDGQRVLLMLYTLLNTATDDCTICIDEPENFLALREINPWLNMLLDVTQTQRCQAILISHHPELINSLALGAGRWIDRTGEAESRSQAISNTDSGLSISELVSRGWLHA